MTPLVLKILTPSGAGEETECESVNLVACDNAAGEGGGSVGILRGHIPAVIALEPGSEVTAKTGGREIKRVRVSGGFAMVKDDTVTVLSEKTENG
jgi:F0F1-type ATP synthase epsilon subunit